MRSFLLYAVIRLGLWAAVWWILVQVGIGVMLAGVLAALIAMLLSIVFLDRLREAAAQRWKAADERRAARKADEVDEDAEYEDHLLDDAEAAAAHTSGPTAGANADAEDAAIPSPEDLPDLPATEDTDTTR